MGRLLLPCLESILGVAFEQVTNPSREIDMKMLSIAAVSLALAVGAFQVNADDAQKAGHKEGAHAAKPPQTITGELVDTGCYLAHEARGTKHIDCATKCISGGMPMGLLTNNGVLYLLTLNHDNPDPYNQLKEMAGKTVSVTGTTMARSGMKGIDVTEVKLVAEAAGK